MQYLLKDEFMFKRYVEDKREELRQGFIYDSFFQPKNANIKLSSREAEEFFEEIKEFPNKEKYKNDEISKKTIVKTIINDIFLEEEKEYFSKLLDLKKDKISQIKDLIILEEKLGLKNILNNKKDIKSSLERVHEKNKGLKDKKYRLVFNIEQVSLLNEFLISPFITQNKIEKHFIPTSLRNNDELKETQKQRLF